LASGGEERHSTWRFLRLGTTAALIRELQNTTSGGFAPVDARAGRNGGTYVCKELVYAYANWISPAHGCCQRRAVHLRGGSPPRVGIEHRPFSTSALAGSMPPAAAVGRSVRGGRVQAKVSCKVSTETRKSCRQSCRTQPQKGNNGRRQETETRRVFAVKFPGAVSRRKRRKETVILPGDDLSGFTWAPHAGCSMLSGRPDRFDGVGGHSHSSLDTLILARSQQPQGVAPLSLSKKVRVDRYCHFLFHKTPDESQHLQGFPAGGRGSGAINPLPLPVAATLPPVLTTTNAIRRRYRPLTRR
jgi:hypothetical protein